MRPTLFAALWGAAGLLWLGAAPAAMTVYKWTDDQGVVHFGDQPPPGVEAERLQLKGSRPEPAPRDEPEKTEKAQDKEAPQALDVNITQAELQVEKLEKRVEQARKTYEQARENRVEGEKIRKGNEQNYVRYLERIERLKAEEKRTKENLEDLRQQLEDARSRLEKLREKKAQQ